MKFGNYNINTAAKGKNRKLEIFRLNKLKTTTNNFVGRFHNKLGSFRRLNNISRSESPLSYCASMFDRDAMYPSNNASDKFSPKDFPNNHHYSTTNDTYYVFRNTMQNVSTNRKMLSGKNPFVKQNIYSTLSSVPTAPVPKTMFRCCETNTAKRRTQQVKRQNSTLKDILDASSCIDEDFEFKVLKDYFDTNSYSDIVKDNDFKNYLSKKKYADILDYMQSDSLSNDAQIDGCCARQFRSQFQTDAIKSEPRTGTFGRLSKSKSTGNLYESINSSSRNSNKPTGCSANIMSRHNGWCNSLKRLKNVFSSTEPKSEPNFSYDEIRKVCENFLDDTTVYGRKTQTSTMGKHYSKKAYRKLVSNFVQGKGFDGVESYVCHKYGAILSHSLLCNGTTSTDRTTVSRRNRKQKSYIDDIEKRYYRTKQTILDADLYGTNCRWSTDDRPNNSFTYAQLETDCSSTTMNAKPKKTYHDYCFKKRYYNGNCTAHDYDDDAGESRYCCCYNRNYAHNLGSSTDNSYINYVNAYMITYFFLHSVDIFYILYIYIYHT